MVQQPGNPLPIQPLRPQRLVDRQGVVPVLLEVDRQTHVLAVDLGRRRNQPQLNFSGCE